MSDSSVLVTGGSGYLGSLVVARLSERAVPTVSVDVRVPRVRCPGVDYVDGDVRTADLAGHLRRRDVTTVIHLAAVVEPPRGMADDELEDIEVGGTRRVIEACVAAGVRHLTLTSSGAAYGYHRRNDGHLLTEDESTPGSEEFAYSRHKAAVESLVVRTRRLHPELGVLLLRPGTILGAGTDNQITALFTGRVVMTFREADPPFVFIWDEDVAEVVVDGALSERTGTYNLAGDGVMRMRDIATVEGARVVALPARGVRLALGLAKRLGVGRYGPEQVDFLLHRPVLDNTRLRRDFPGMPRKTTREAYEVFRQGRSRARGGVPGRRGSDTVIDGAVAVVTGAGGQIGRRLMADLEAGGAAVVGLDLPSALPEGDGRYIVCDITDEAQVRDTFAALRDRYGRLDLLIHCAGLSAIGRFEDHDLDMHRRVMEVTHLGAVACTLAALPDLRRSHGRVVLIGSVAGFAPVLGRPPYVAAKHAVTGLFTALRPELRAEGVGVTIVHPTFVTGGMAEVARRSQGTQRVTTGEELTPQDVSTAVIDGVVQGRDLVLVGRTARLAWYANRFAPRVYSSLMERRLHARPPRTRPRWAGGRPGGGTTP